LTGFYTIYYSGLLFWATLYNYYAIELGVGL